MTDNTSALKMMSVGDVIDYSIEVYKRNFKKLTTLTLIFYIPFIFLVSLVLSYFSADMENLSNFEMQGQSQANFTYFQIAYYISILVILLFYLIYSLTLKTVFDASVAKIVYFDAVYNTRYDIKSVIKECFKKLKTLFINRLLYYLIIFGVVAGAYILMFIVLVLMMLGFMSAGFMASEPDTLTGIFIVIGLVALLLILLLPLMFLISYFYAKYGMGIHSVIIESKGPAEAISRCNDIGRRSFWSISLSFMLGLILFFAVPSIISVAAQSLTSNNKVLYMSAYTVSQIVWAVINPYITTLLTIIFINQKIKNEGLDLEVKVDKMIKDRLQAAEVEINGDIQDEKE